MRTTSLPAFLFSAALAAGLANEAAAQRLISYDPATGAMAELQPPDRRIEVVEASVGHVRRNL